MILNLKLNKRKERGKKQRKRESIVKIKEQNKNINKWNMLRTTKWWMKENPANQNWAIFKEYSFIYSICNE